MTAAELREAVDRFDGSAVGDPMPRWIKPVLVDAARTIALPILEADPELVERIKTTLDQKLRHPLADVYTAKGIDVVVAQLTHDVLAAISTPTPGAETTTAAAPPAAYDYETEAAYDYETEGLEGT